MAGSDTRERTALIVTVLDEAATIDTLLQSVAAQTRAPDEIVIVDGGSSDGTLERLHAWQSRLPLTVVEAPGASISQGRNKAIAATQAELVAVTDAGVRLEPDWLANLLACMTERVEVVSGFFVGEAHTRFERAMAATVLPAVEDINAESFLPSSRSVLFRRRAWQRVGGYPEWLDYCEDLVFDLALRRAGCRFVFQPQAVAHFRPRGTAKAFFRQYYLYARGDGKAGLWPRRHAIRYTTYLAALLLARRGPTGWLLLLIGGLAYSWRPYQRLWRPADGLPAGEMVLVPVIRLIGDVAKMLGFPVGIAWAWRRWTSQSSS